MVFGIIKTWANRKLTQRAEQEFAEWVDKLRYIDSSEIAPIVLFANYERLKIKELFGVDMFEPQMALLLRPNIRMELHDLIGVFQREGAPNLASGVMVWLFTLRAAADPALRKTGRELWRQLARGFDGVQEAAVAWEMMGKPPIATFGADRFPTGFTPDPL